jgi:hypothetical protein
VTRDLFETEADRAREHAAAAALADRWHCEMIGAPPLAGFDYLASRGGVLVAVVEIKNRLNRAPADHGGTLLMDVRKRDSINAAAAALGGCVPVLAWRFAREVRWIDTRTLADRPAVIRGRTDRDGLDQHPAILIRLAETRRVRTPCSGCGWSLGEWCPRCGACACPANPPRCAGGCR